MSNQSDIFEFKSPEQLNIGDVIPAWAADFVVEKVIPFDENSMYEVLFTNGRVINYPVGTTLRVRK